MTVFIAVAAVFTHAVALAFAAMTAVFTKKQSAKNMKAKGKSISSTTIREHPKKCLKSYETHKSDADQVGVALDAELAL